MNLEHTLEIARVRAEKLNSLKKEIKTSAEVYKGLLPTEGYYDSFAEQFERREQRVEELENQLEQAMAELDFWKERVSKMVNSKQSEDLDQEVLDERKEYFVELYGDQDWLSDYEGWCLGGYYHLAHAEDQKEINRLQGIVDSIEEQDAIEHQLRSVSWNLNRIANVLEENFALSDAQSILAKLRQKGGKR